MALFIHSFKRGNALFYLIACLLGFALSQSALAHGVKYHEFRPIDHRVGMDASVVNCVVQDIQGLIWLGTDRGLYSFDGYSARHYNSRMAQGQSNIGVIYCAMMIDSSHLWLGADNGLFIFNTYTDCYETAPSGLPSNIRAISRIDAHTLWIGGLNGLYRYDTQTKKAEKISNTELPHQAIYSILRYNNLFYFGTYNGLCQFNLETGKFKKIALNSGNPSSNKLILSLLPDYNRQCIWVGIEGGLFAFNPVTEKWTEESLFKGSSVKSLLLDNQNCLWAGTDNGLFIFEPNSKNYRLFRHDALNDKSIIDNVIWSVFSDNEHNIWIGTDAGASLFAYNNHYKQQSLNELTGSHEGNYIISMLVDTKGNIWLGGTNGIIKVDKLTGKTTWYQQNSKTNSLPHNKVRYVYEDLDGDIWIATDGSICRYNAKTSQFVRYQIEDATHTHNANWSYAICQDETRKLWIATCMGGLFVVDKQQLITSTKEKFISEQNYYSNTVGAQCLSGNMLEFLALDKDRNIWAGTYRAGVNKIDRLNHTVLQLTTSSKSPLSSDDVTAMIVDSENYLWIALRNKIVRIDTRNYSQKTITDPRINSTYINSLADDGKRIWMGLSTGLFFIDKTTFKIRQVNTGGNFYSSVFYDKNSRHLFAGGTNEFLEFDPETASEQDPLNHLYLTSLWVNDKLADDLSFSQQIKLGESTRFSKSIELPHNLNNLAFTFSEFTYNQSQSAQYTYKLEGLDEDWHIAERGNNRITYNNLLPGDYKLLISRVGSDGKPLKNTLIFSIVINHPWYSSWIAKCIYSLLFVLLIIAFANYYTVLNRLRFERIDKVKTMELTTHKIDFLTNISHELKTPLSLIIGPLGKIIEQVKPATLKGELSEVRQNALKMSSLIHQMMDASRQEFDGFGLIVSNTDVVAFSHSVVSAFQKPLLDRNIQINIETSLASCFIEADVLKLEIILNNILSNASKFAPDNSVITFKIQEVNNQVKLSVTDQGSGINEQDLPHVFERFFQSRHTISQNKEGSGVGLSIVKEYVQLHHGVATVLSDGSNGTTVEIILPTIQVVDNATTTSELPQSSPSNELDSKPLLLIVEDNTEISSFISKNLAKEFRCICLPNGKLGLEAAINHSPNIIITDIMMPIMDGMELCRKLKENIATSLIPVVMLTAKDDKSTEILGYRTGADAFIAKPFEIEYLTGRLQQLLRGRNLLVQKVRQEAITQPKADDVLSTDEKLLAIITQIIEDEITNPDLNVNVLCEKSGYNLKQIYRRIKSLTGQTVVDYIRSIRLKKAAMLLSRKTFTVAEVMYMVGFNNHSYFSKRFQEMYGKTPKQYAEETNNTNSIQNT